MKQEDFSKVENESFYTSPPYKYRPSIAEYLTTGNVTENGFIADIMHMDHKKNIKIISIKEKIFNIKLLKNNDLDYSEVIIWDYLKSLEKNGEIIFNIDKVPRRVKNNFFNHVRRKSYEKFNNPIFNLNKNKSGDPFSNNSLIKGRILAGFIFTIFNFGGLLQFIFLILGINKLSKDPKDLKFFSKRFVFKYLKISLYYLLFFGLVFLIGPVYAKYIANFDENVFYPLVIGSILIVIFTYLAIFYSYSCMIYDYLSWIFESEMAKEHRINWLEFKKFVIDNSEIEKSPLSHYRLWGPFYYYTLAVGGIKSPY